jgi:hypothetical protein
MRGKSIFFQESDQLLAIKLRDILFSRQDRFLLGIPWSVYVGPLNSKWTLQTLKIHLSTRVFWIGIMMHKPKMLSFARGDIFHEKSDCIPDLLSSIERRGNTLVVIGNSRVLSSLPIESDKIIKIEVMEKNAFKQINDVSSQIENLLRLYGDSLTLCLAAGPAGKVLGFRFSGRCQILDLGHGFDFIRDGKWAWVWNEHE